MNRSEGWKRLIAEVATNDVPVTSVAAYPRVAAMDLDLFAPEAKRSVVGSVEASVMKKVEEE